MKEILVLKLDMKWPFLAVGIVLSALFFLFGVRQLIMSYHTNDPFHFLMLFFSSSMIILVNGAIFIILLILGYTKHHRREQQGTEEEPPHAEQDGH